MSTLTTIRLDPFNPVLAPGTKSLQVTAEQDLYIREVLDICSSDSASAKKAYKALKLILTVGLPADPPTLTSVTPSTTVQSVPVIAVVVGTGFLADSVVRASGAVQTTTFVSATELSFSPDVTTVLTHDIYVENYDMQKSNSLSFDVTAPV